MEKSTRRALVFYVVVVSAAALVLLQRLLAATVVTSGDVVAWGEQLARLVARTRVATAGADAIAQVTWTYASPCGGYRGLAVRTQWRRGPGEAVPESLLAVHLDVESAGLLRQPGRRRLPVGRLVRDGPGSDVAAPGEQGLAVSLLLDPDPRAPGAPQRSLVIDDRPAGPAAAAGAAWPLSFAASTGCKLSEEDLALMAVVARTLRGRVCADLAVPASCVDTALALYPDLPPRRYRVDLSALGGERGRLRFRLELGLEGGRLASGRLTPLRDSDLALAAQLYVVPPKASGELLLPSDPGLVVLRYTPATGEVTGRTNQIDFATLLSGTAWR